MAFIAPAGISICPLAGNIIFEYFFFMLQ